MSTLASPRAVGTDHLQQQVDSLPAGATVELAPNKEFAGPITIRQALDIDGRGATVWALQGPVIIVEAKQVRLRNLRIEATGDVLDAGTNGDCALRVEQGCRLSLDNVEIRGAVQGWPEEAGEWHYPHSLQLGTLVAGCTHRFGLRLRVPVACRISSKVSGIEVRPDSLMPGDHNVQILIERLPGDTLLNGELVISTKFLRRRIYLGARIQSDDSRDGATLLRGKGQCVWDHRNPLSGRRGESVGFSAEKHGWGVLCLTALLRPLRVVGEHISRRVRALRSGAAMLQFAVATRRPFVGDRRKPIVGAEDGIVRWSPRVTGPSEPGATCHELVIPSLGGTGRADANLLGVPPKPVMDASRSWARGRGVRPEVAAAVDAAFATANNGRDLQAAADLLEDAMRKAPWLRDRYTSQLALWRKGIMHCPANTLTRRPGKRGG